MKEIIVIDESIGFVRVFMGWVVVVVFCCVGFVRRRVSGGRLG